jgi:hypothetical protein
VAAPGPGGSAVVSVADVFDWYFTSGDVEFHAGGGDPHDVQGVRAGHGDLYTQEVRLAADDIALIHEYSFRGRADDSDSRLLIECANFTHEMVPPDQSARR